MSKINYKPMDEMDRRLILSLAENNMRATETSYDLDVHRGTVIYRMGKIKAITGLDPMVFYDLCKLVEMVRGKEPGKGWIPTSLGMPEEFVSVLVYIPSEAPMPVVKEAYFANGSWSTKMWIHPASEVTYWMPMPEPPKGGA